MTAVLSLQKRWSRLASILKRMNAEMTRPATNAMRKSSVVICGRSINNIVCAFAVPDQITNKVLNELNGCLMRMETSEDVLKASSCELAIIQSLRDYINSKINDLSKEIAASKVFSK
jgi:hypothetical protein